MRAEEYSLSAVLGSLRAATRVYGDPEAMSPELAEFMIRPGAEPWEIADADASMNAIPVVLDRAVGDPLWARGRITLRHKKSGRIVRVMAPKNPSPEGGPE